MWWLNTPNNDFFIFFIGYSNLLLNKNEERRQKESRDKEKAY